MSRRARGLALLVAALACAGIAAAIAAGYGERVADRYGELRPVVVATRALPARRALDPRRLARSVEVRRVPLSFVPPDALSSPEQAAGRAPVAPVAAGGYLLGSQLRAPRSRPPSAAAGPGRIPVEIAVSGAEALSFAAGPASGASVDVAVTGEPGVGRAGATRLAARGVRLLSVREGGGGEAASPGPARSIATLALTRTQALRLIEAESFARDVRLLPRPRR